jgi:hypothetical protein
VSETSFVKNVVAGVEKIGLRNAPMVYALAKVPWKSAEDRDMVLDWVGQDDGQ